MGSKALFIQYRQRKNAKGLKQLKKYVECPKKRAGNYIEGTIEKKVFNYGNDFREDIPSGEFCFKLDVYTPKAIEHVRYDVSYEVANTGMIYYSFVRVLEGKDPPRLPVKEKEAVTAFETSKKTAHKDVAASADTLVNQIPNNIEEENDVEMDDDGNIVDGKGHIIVSIGAMGAFCVIAGGLIKIHSKTVDKTSHSGFIISKCIEFLNEVKTNKAATILAAIADFKIILSAIGIPSSIIAAAEEIEGEDDTQKINELIESIQDEAENYKKAGDAQPPRDPLIIDLGIPGIELHSLANGVNFDLDNNGFAEKTAWIGSEDGFLALDRNKNGRIDNGGELFGDQVILKDGLKSASGFEALAELDENGDGMIDKNDPQYANLRVWIDVNRNGISETNELKTLDEIGVISISLDHTEISFVDEETGSRIAESSSVTINRNGIDTTTEISEFWFPVN